MRRPALTVVAVLAALALTACGSSKSPTKAAASGPAAQALSYFPTTTPFVMTIPTNGKSGGLQQTRALQQRFPEAMAAETALLARLAQLGIDYNKQIRPLFGNPIAVGLGAARLHASHLPFILAWVTRDRSALRAIVSKLGATLTKAGTHDGATLYGLGDTCLAVDGATLLLARSTQDMDAALDRHRAGSGFTLAAYDRLTAGLPASSVLKMAGNLTSVLSAPSAAKTRAIPWVAALRGYGVSLDAGQSGMTFHFRVDTTGRSLSADQLPITAGATPPALAGPAPIEAGLHGLRQSIAFAEDAVRAASPKQYAKFLSDTTRLKRRTGFDLTSFVAMLTGDVGLASDGHSTIGRVGVSDPPAVAAMVAKLVRAPALAFAPGTTVAPLGGGLYRIREKDGTTLTMGVVGDQLVLGKATTTQIRSFAHAAGGHPAGAGGAVAFRIALPQLLRVGLAHAPSAAAQALLGHLGDITGSVLATPGGLMGSATLAVK